jgi:hypothetical protein
VLKTVEKHLQNLGLKSSQKPDTTEDTQKLQNGYPWECIGMKGNEGE